MLDLTTEEKEYLANFRIQPLNEILKRNKDKLYKETVYNNNKQLHNYYQGAARLVDELLDYINKTETNK